MKNSRLTVLQGDITHLEVDAIVNAANTSLLGGGGVDGAIHKAAGIGLLEECRTLGGCPIGEAKITKAYKLSARYVIHAVGPVWHDGSQGESRLLESAYHACLDLADEYQLQSIAFPNISTGVFGFPKEKAAMIALSVVAGFTRIHCYPLRVIFVCFDEKNYRIYRQLFDDTRF